jgi:hypothetical protein
MLKYAPTNEQEVVYLFGFICEKLDYTIERIQADFPDCILIDPQDNKLNAEFEYKTSNFILHKHPFDTCDIVIAWEDDYGLKNKMKVIELCNYFPQLKDNPNININDLRINKTLEGLSLIARGVADKENLLKLFGKYHIKEQEREPIRFIARLIINAGDPYVSSGKLSLKNPIDKSNFKYSVSENQEAMTRAQEILKELEII